MSDEAPAGSAENSDLARNTFYTLLGRIAGLLVGFLLSPVILVALGDHDFGLWVLAYALGAHFCVVFEIGSGTALIYHVALARAEQDEGRLARAIGAHLLFTTLMAALAFLALLLAAPLLTRWLGLEPGLRLDRGSVYGFELLLIAVGSALLRPLGLAWDCVLQGCERFDHAGRLSIVRAALWAVLALLVLDRGGGPRALLLADFLVLMLMAVPGTLVAWRSLPGSRQLLGWPSMAELRAHVRFGAGVYVSLVTELFNAQSDKLLIGGALTPLQVKAYELGQKITLPGRMALAMLAQVLFPTVPGLLANEGTEGLRRLHVRAQKLMVFAAGLLFAFLTAAAPTALAAWLGPTRVGPDTELALRMLAGVYGLHLLTVVPIQLARGYHRLQVELRTALIFSIIGLLLRFLALQWAGFFGLLVAGLIVALAMTLTQLWAFASVLEYRLWPHLRTSTLPALAAALLIGLGVGLCDTLLPLPALPDWLGARTPFIARLALDGLVFVLLVPPLSWALGLIDEDLQKLWGHIIAMARR